ncbi:MAG TPA: tetratricopeptide repeat protein [Myxococcota bacterium]|nr:tetratricopeptide repeat protein [Myxococcota bacterium]
MLDSPARSQFCRLAALPDAQIDLAEAALWIAAEEYPDLDVPLSLARLADLSRSADERMRGARSLHERVARLNDFLYRESGFTGNREDYYDARNSFLNDVLERRTGIPITLAIVYVSIAERLGLRARGVGFPGHFLVRVDGPEAILIDPFAGAVVTRAECEARLRAATGAEVPFDPGLLDPTPARQILARVLRNLKQIWLAREDWQRALACAERILLLAPDAPLELRDRGLLFARLECFAAAEADLRRFLALAPEDAGADAVRAQLVDLARSAPRLH